MRALRERSIDERIMHAVHRGVSRQRALYLCNGGIPSNVSRPGGLIPKQKDECVTFIARWSVSRAGVCASVPGKVLRRSETAESLFRCLHERHAHPKVRRRIAKKRCHRSPTRQAGYGLLPFQSRASSAFCAVGQKTKLVRRVCWGGRRMLLHWRIAKFPQKFECNCRICAQYLERRGYSSGPFLAHPGDCGWLRGFKKPKTHSSMHA